MILLWSTLLWAQARLDRVHMWRNGAELTYARTGVCEQGVATIDFSDLDASVQSETMSFNTFGTRVISHQVYTRTPAEEEVLAQEEVDLEKELRAIELELMLLKDKHEQISSYEVYFQLYLRKDLKRSNPSPLKWTKAMNTLVSQRKAVEQERIQLEKRQRDIVKRKRAIEHQKSSEAAGLGVKIAVSCEGNKRADVELRVFVPLATWEPVYELILDDVDLSKPEVRLRLSALISQSTKQEWRNVELTLIEAEYDRMSLNHSGAVVVEGVKPFSVLSSEYLGAVEPSSLLQDSAIASRPTAYQKFKVPHRVTLYSSSDQWVPVAAEDVPVVLQIRAAPMVSPSVLQNMRFSIPPHLRVAAAAQLFKDEAFLGVVDFQQSKNLETVTLSIGQESDLKVFRERVESKERRAKAAAQNVQTVRFKVIISNASDLQRQLVVAEPVPSVQSYSIELLPEKSTQGYTWSDEEQAFLWEIEVPPRGQKEIFVTYKVASF